MGRFGKFNAAEMAKEVQKFFTKGIPELEQYSEKTLKKQVKAQDLLKEKGSPEDIINKGKLKKGEQGPELLINKQFIKNLEKAASKNQLPPELFPGNFDSFKNSLWYKVKDENDIDALIEVVSKHYSKSALEARRGNKKGVLKDEVVKELADELNISIKTLQNRRIGSVYTVEQMYGAIKLLKDFRKVLKLALKKAVSENASGQEKAFAVQMTQTYSSVLNQVMGARAELGRSFRILREMKNGFDQIQDEDKALQAVFDSIGGKELNERKLEALYGIIENNENSVARATRQLNLASTRDMLFQVYYNNLLSGIDTHMVNLGAGVVLQHFHHLARFAGGTKGSVNKMLNKQYKGLTFKQALAGYYGYMQSMIDGTRVFASSLLTGRSIDTFSKVPIDDSISGGKITVRNLTYNSAGKVNKRLRERLEEDPTFLNDNAFTQGADAILDVSTRYAPRFMRAADDMLKFIFYRSELHTYAYNKAMQEVENGVIADKDFSLRVKEIINDPIKQAPDIRMKALDAARDTVLQRRLDKFGSAIYGVLKEQANVPGSAVWGTALKVIMPFFGTLYNLTKVGVELTPVLNLGLASMPGSKLNTMLKSGNQMERDMAIGHLIASHGMVFMSVLAAQNGYVKGGDPVFSSKRDAQALKFMKTGPDEFSIVVPWSRIDPDGEYKGVIHDGKDRSYQINRLDPAGQWLALGYNIAQMGEAEENEISEAVVRAILSVGEKTLSSSFAVNIADTIEIFTDDYGTGDPSNFTRKLIKWGARNVNNFIPTSSRMRMNINKLGDIDEEGNLIARSGDLPDIFTVEDPDDGQIKIFVDNGDGTYEMIDKPSGVVESGKDMINAFNFELQNELNKRKDRDELQQSVDWWGRDATEDPRVGPGGVIYSPVKYRDMEWNTQDLIDSNIFSEDDVKKTVPLLHKNEQFDTIANLRTEDGKPLFNNILNIVGVAGEFERLSYGPSNHPAYISIRGQRIKLNREQHNDYKKMINGDFSSLPPSVLENIEAYVSPEYYENVMANNVTLKQNLMNLFNSDMYYIYGSDDDTATTSREKMINDTIQFHRHGKPEQFKNSFETSENLRLGLDGPDKLLMLKYPDLKYKALELLKNINDKNMKPLRDVIGVD